MKYEEFLNFENDSGVFDIRIGGIAVWERVRWKVLKSIRKNETKEAKHSKGSKYASKYLRGSLLFAKNLIYKNPFLAKNADIVFVGHPRRKREADMWWDIYCDPIHEASQYDYVHFEKQHNIKHYEPAMTENLRWLTLIEYGGTIQKLLGLKAPAISPESESNLRAVEYDIRTRFGIDVDLHEIVRSNLHHRAVTLPLYRRLLRKINPKCLVIVVSYGKETIIEAANELSIPVAELQHGAIHPHDPGYQYPKAHSKQTFPDYLLTWGKFWSQNVSFPIPNDRVLPVGYPYLEERIERYNNISPRNQLLFISWGTVGQKLARLALDCAVNNRIDMDVIYKLHPSEFSSWRNKYPWLLDSGVTVIDGQSPSLYELFAQSRAQVSVGSTAVYEGLCFDLETYVYDVEGASRLMPLVDAGAAEVIDSADALATHLGRGVDTFEREYYFAADALPRMQETLERLMASGTVYERA